MECSTCGNTDWAVVLCESCLDEKRYGPARIVVTVSGGLVQNVEGVPSGVVVEVRDYDGDHEKCEDCTEDAEGELMHACEYR